MNKPGTHTSRFSLYLLSMIFALVMFVLCFAAYTRAEDAYEKAEETRQASFLLADEMRESSNDLTRMSRSYVVTGDPAFKQQFMDVLAIRDGRLARPVDYGPTYWDFHYDGMPRAGTAGRKVSLLQLMREAGFTSQELATLAESKMRSDALTKLEITAMDLSDEFDTPGRGLKRAIAVDMLFNSAFHSAKLQIMKPIREFDSMVRERVNTMASKTQKRLDQIKLVLVGLGIFVVFCIWKTHQTLYVILGCKVPELQSIIARLGTGNFFTPIHVSSQKQNSVLGWIAQAQKRLANMELLQFKAIIEHSDDAIISKTMDGIITSWNKGAERIFGYTQAEAIGQSILMLIPADRMDEEPALLARIAKGELVEQLITKRRCKDGRLIDISATISPIKDFQGRVIGASKIARDITREKEAELEIHRLAFYDHLTGLPNRRLFLDRLNQTLLNVRRTGFFSAVLFIDLDNFKTLNDTHGHDAGDLLLQQVAERLQACVRESDTVARFGGDEFVILLEGQQKNITSTIQWVDKVGHKILDKLSTMYEIGGLMHQSTPSIGVTLVSAESTDVNELLKQADTAMYRAKLAGRNNICFFHQPSPGRSNK